MCPPRCFICAQAVESKSSAFYYTQAGPGGPDGWTRSWYDISTGITDPAQKALVLGGEISMWSDTYCYEDQCGAFSGPTPVGAKLFDPKYDQEFSQSIGGTIKALADLCYTAFRMDGWMCVCVCMCVCMACTSLDLNQPMWQQHLFAQVTGAPFHYP